jgi:hypothetical protein
MLATAVAMAPCHPNRFAGSDKSRCAAQASTLGSVAHLALSLQKRWSLHDLRQWITVQTQQSWHQPPFDEDGPKGGFGTRIPAFVASLFTFRFMTVVHLVRQTPGIPPLRAQKF